MLFISYRIDDSASATDRLDEYLAKAFGDELVFRDRSRITPGRDFERMLRTALEQTRLVVAVIGPRWLESFSARATSPAFDYVRWELETAIELGIPILAVLVEGARAPRKDELPESLASLASVHAAPVRGDPDFRRDIEGVVEAIRGMVPVDPPVYLSAADRQIEPYFGEADFDRTLLMNLLLQPAIALPDVYFLYSGHMDRHVSLIQEGLKTGVVIPYFRERDCDTFGRTLDWVEKAGIDGRMGERTRASARARARSFDAATLAPAFRLRHWPSWSLGEEYARMAQKLLITDDVPEPWGSAEADVRAQMSRIWDITRPWRHDCLQAAIDKTRSDVGAGLRRSALIAAVAESIHEEFSSRAVEDVDELSRYAEPSKRVALRCFFRWLNDIYYFGQARAFQAAPSFPACQPLQGAMVTPLLAEASAGPTNISSEEAIIDVRMPPLRLLRQVKASELLAVRKSCGAGYLQALREWRLRPTSGTLDEVERALREYSSAFRSSVAKTGDEAHPLSLRLRRTGPGAVFALGVAGAALAANSPAALATLVVVGAGSALYSWHQTASTDVTVKIGSAASGESFADVNILPVPSTGRAS
jgi:hypothetical protein